MANPIMPVTPIIERSCDVIEQLVGNVITACADVSSSLKQYESTLETLNLLKMAIRHAEGVVELARNDLVLLPPAVAAARACLEISVKASWLVDVDDPFDREARYLAYLAAEERYLKRISGRLVDQEIASKLVQREQTIRNFRLGVTSQLPQRIRQLPGTPSFEEMLTTLGGESIYPMYIMLSQAIHGEHAATWYYRSGGLGTHQKVGEFIKPTDWWLPLKVCFLSLSRSPQIILPRLGIASDQCFNKTAMQNLEAQIDEIAKDNGRSIPRPTR
jgi:Family of unknown function (DUF5677)